MSKVTIFTDGSSLGNPGPGGYGAIVVFENETVVELGGHEKETTNNRMEMSAAIESLRKVQNKKNQTRLAAAEPRRIKIYTDSSYVLSGITKWIHGWHQSNWKTKAKEDVLNKDLWQELFTLVYLSAQAGGGELTVDWQHIKGHVGIVGNERADLIATSFAEENPIELFEGSLKDYEDMVGESLLEIPEITHEHPKRSHQKAYSYVSLVDGRIETHKTWADCENRVKGVSGAKYKKTINKKDEEGIIKDWQQTLF